MNLTKKIKHIFRSAGVAPIHHEPFKPREIHERIPTAKGTTVKDIMCRLERQGVLTKYFSRDNDGNPGHKFVVSFESSIPLWRLIKDLEIVMAKYGTMSVYSDHPMKFEVVDDGDINYMLVEGK